MKEKERTCEWKKIEHDDFWRYYITECGEEYDGTEIGHYSYCPYCGGKIIIYDPPSAEDEKEQRIRDNEIDSMGRIIR